MPYLLHLIKKVLDGMVDVEVSYAQAKIIIWLLIRMGNSSARLELLWPITQILVIILLIVSQFLKLMVITAIELILQLWSMKVLLLTSTPGSCGLFT